MFLSDIIKMAKMNPVKLMDCYQLHAMWLQQLQRRIFW